MDFSQFQINQLTELFTSAWGIFIVAMFVLLVLATAVLPAAKWWALTMLLFASSMGVELTRTHLISPLQEIRTFTRPICVALLVALLAPAIRQHRQWRMRIVLMGTILFFIFEIYLTVLLLFGQDFYRGYFGAISYVLIFLTLAIGLGRWFQTIEDVHSALRAMVFAGALIIFGSLSQVVVNPAAVIWGNRMHGTTGNANFLGVAMAITMLPAAYLATRNGVKLAGRFYYILLVALAGFLIVWSGSRTAAAMAVVGIAMFFRKHLVRLVIMGAIASVICVLIWSYFSPDSANTTSRLFDTTDTRTVIWTKMFNEFVAHPLFGNAGGKVHNGSENSLLQAASLGGVVGLIPFLLGLILILRSMFSSSKRLSSQPGPYKDLAELVKASVISLLVGSQFEGYLVALYAFPILSLFIYFAIITFMEDVAATQQPAFSFDPQIEAMYEENVESPLAIPGY